MKESKITAWNKFRIWLGFNILPNQIKTIIANAMMIETMFFDCPEKFADWLVRGRTESNPNKEEVH